MGGMKMEQSVTTDKVLATSHGYENLDIERSILAKAGIELVECADEDLVTMLPQYKTILVQYVVFDRKLLSLLQPGTVLIRYGIGVDNIDLEAAKELKIAVSNLPTYGLNAVSEFAAAAILANVTRLKLLDSRFAKLGWQQSEVPYAHESSSLTIGIVGFGGIGQKVYEKLSGFDFSFRIFDPVSSVIPDAAKCSLEELFAESDCLTLHCPLTEKTRHLLNDEQFARMKKNVCLVNTSRGAVIDTEALIRALDKGKIGHAVLDVFEDEPLAQDSLLFNRENVILSPHISWKTAEAERNLHHMAGEQARRAVSQKNLPYRLV